MLWPCGAVLASAHCAAQSKAAERRWRKAPGLRREILARSAELPVNNLGQETTMRAFMILLALVATPFVASVSQGRGKPARPARRAAAPRAAAPAAAAS